MNGRTEKRIRSDLRELLKQRGWLVEITHGNRFQFGIPDFYCHHPQFDYRWIDVKRPSGYRLTRAQQIKWPLWESFGVGIWILTATTESEYDKLFGKPNWRQYWRGKATIESQQRAQ